MTGCGRHLKVSEIYDARSVVVMGVSRSHCCLPFNCWAVRVSTIIVAAYDFPIEEPRRGIAKGQGKEVLLGVCWWSNVGCDGRSGKPSRAAPP
jgi:hypothetical protein